MTITASVVEDSVPDINSVSRSTRLTTLQLRYPRFIHAEFMTHRAFSRNASSSRAIPVKKMIEDVIDDKVYPSFWGSNKPGMQAGPEINTLIPVEGEPRMMTREDIWDRAREDAIQWAMVYNTAGFHKQIVNRLLEPFAHINVVVTATEWQNFFELRLHPDAQPEMRELAEKMNDALSKSHPRALMPDEWHLPYLTDVEKVRVRHFWEQFNSSRDQSDARKNYYGALHSFISYSIARCARVSYRTHQGAVPKPDEDFALAQRLLLAKPRHASPAEHQARLYGVFEHHLQKNFVGWVHYRTLIEETHQFKDYQL